MTNREALYRMILSHPADDTLRLISADALEEEGDERRAAVIRSQVELASLPPSDPRRLRARYSGTDAVDPEWLAGLSLPTGITWAEPAFRRGFPAAIRAEDVRVFVTHAEELFSQFPIEALELEVARLGESAAFAACPGSRQLRRLAILQGVSGPSARRLLALPATAQLRELHIGAGLTTAATAHAIVGSPPFTQLTHLTYRDGRTAGELVAALTRLADPPQLITLDLAGNRLTTEQLTRLLAAPILATVDELDLSDDLGGGAITALASTRLPHLHCLHLNRTRPGLDGVRSLVEASFFPELRCLALGGNHLPDSAARLLANHPGDCQLLVLELSENRLGDLGVTALANSPQLRQLLALDLRANAITDAGAFALAESPVLHELLHLDLSGNPISAVGQDRLRERFGEHLIL
jgi:uncharacterized protein (TIGR02996 family)